MLTGTPPTTPSGPGGQSSGSRTAIWVAFAAAFIAVGVAFVVIAIALVRDDTTTAGTTSTAAVTTTESTTTASTATTVTTTAQTSTTSESTTTTSTSTASTSTTEPSTTVTTSFAAIDTAVWPEQSSATRFSEPVPAARSFGVDYLGFDDPVVGQFFQGDSRSGEVEIRPDSGGPVTTVLLRQLGANDDWWVIGSVSAEITLDMPEVLEIVDTPLVVSGQAVIAGGGGLEIQLVADGVTDPIATDSMTVAPGAATPFRFELDWISSADWGEVALFTTDRSTGETTGGQVMRLRLAQS